MTIMAPTFRYVGVQTDLSTLTTPPSGEFWLGMDASGNPAVKDDTGTITAIDQSGGSGYRAAAQTADGSTSIQAAHDALPSGNAGNSPGGVIEVAPSYDPTNETLPITIDTPCLIEGHGVLASHLDFSGNTTNDVFELALSNNRQYHVIMRNLQIQGGDMGIDVQTCNRLGLYNVWIRDQATSNVIFNLGATGDGALWTQFERCHFRSAGGVGVDMRPTNDPNYPNATTFLGGLVQDAGSQGVIAKGSQVAFYNFDASQNAGVGLQLGDASNVTTAGVYGGYFENNTGSDIKCNDAASSSSGGGGHYIGGTWHSATGVGIDITDSAETVVHGSRGQNIEGAALIDVGSFADDTELYSLKVVDDSAPPVSDSGIRTLVDGQGENAGDPATTGDWNTNGRRGVRVWDSTNSNLYEYAGGAWQGPL